MKPTSTSPRSLTPRSIFPGRRPAFCALAFVLLFVLSGCRVVILSGPSDVDVGDTVVYVLELGSNQGSQPDTSLYLDVQVPSGWNFVAGTFEGSLGGQEMSGPLGVGMAQDCTALIGPLPDGFQRFSVDPGGTFTTSDEDEGTVTLEFQVLDQPAGPFDISFVFGGSGGVGTGCSAVTRKRINRESRALLEIEQEIRDPFGDPIGTGRIERLVSSSDSRDLYSFRAQAFVDDVVIPGAVSLYRRGGTGELELVEGTLDDDDQPLGQVMDAVLSPDGRHLYVVDVASDELGLFTRSEATGSLLFVESLPIEPRNVHRDVLLISPDGAFLYLGDQLSDEITIFARDPADGRLTPTSPFGSLGSSPSALETDPGGAFLYVAFFDQDKLMVLARNSEDGSLQLVQEVVDQAQGVDGLMAPSSLAMSPDGTTLYVGGLLSNDRASLVGLERDLSTGELSFIESLPTFPPFVSTDQALTVSSGGERLFAGLRATLVSFRRAADGSLTFEDSFEDGYFLRGLLESADRRHLVTHSFIDRALLSYRIFDSKVFADGFESGDTSAWTTTSP